MYWTISKTLNPSKINRSIIIARWNTESCNIFQWTKYDMSSWDIFLHGIFSWWDFVLWNFVLWDFVLWDFFSWDFFLHGIFSHGIFSYMGFFPTWDFVLMGFYPDTPASCDVRVVKEMDLKSIGLCQHRFESCLQRNYIGRTYKLRTYWSRASSY